MTESHDLAAPGPVADELITVWCEVCGREDRRAAADAFQAGWDFAGPGGVYPAGVLTPRTCPDCPVSETTWWRLAVQNVPPGQLTEHDRAVIDRIRSEQSAE